MSTPAIPQSPTARLLLELATQRTSCELALGQRTLVLVEGALVDVRGTPDDCSLPAFLAAAGRIEEHERQVVEERIRDVGLSVDQALGELSELAPEVVLETRRALLLDRMVRAFAALENADGSAAPQPTPLRSAARGPSFDLVEIVLDALARRAAFGAAEVVGELRRARFVWIDAPAQKRAASWAELGDIPHAMSVATLFPRHPAAPSRIAALVRSGVARLDAGGVSAAPSAKASVKPPAPLSDTTVVVAAPSPAEEPLREPEWPALGPLGIVPVGSWLPTPRTVLADPLFQLEETIAQLDAASASPPERAAAWLSLARAFQEQQQASAEATRAAREAAAADPSDPSALAAAAAWTGTTGAPAMAYAYARAWATVVTDPAERASAWTAAADYARRAERPHEQRLALKSAVEAAPEDAGLQEQLARALARNDERALAVEHARKAAELLRGRQPERTRVLLAWAAELVPGNLRTWNDLAKSLVRSGRSRVGVAALAHAARVQTDSALKERLRLSAIAFAELTTDRESAIELLLEAIDSGSALSEPLLAHLHAIGAWVEIAIFAEQLAARAKGTERAALLVDAAEARAQLHDGAAGAIELLTRAMCADPESTPIYDALAALTVEHDCPEAHIEALERAVRAWDLPDELALDEDRRNKLTVLLKRVRELPSEATTAPLTQFAAERWARLSGHAVDEQTALKLSEYRARFDSLAERLEQELRAAEPQARTLPALRLAGLLRQDPARRQAARKLYEKVLEREPHLPDALRGLESLLRLETDEAGLDALFERRAKSTPKSARAELALAHRRQRAGRLDEALAACEAAFTQLASTRLAQAEQDIEREQQLRHELMILQWRLAVARGDLAKIGAALELLAAHAPSSERRASLLMRLARVQRARGERAAAVATAELALADGSADAALALLHDIVDLSIAPRIEVLSAMRALLGDTPELLRQLARAAFATRDPQGQREALEALAKLAPDDGFAARSLVALQTTGRDASALCQVIERALEPGRFGKQTPHVVQPALVRLGALAGLERSVALVQAAVEQLGEQARPLLIWADSVAAELPSLAQRAQLLEQLAAHADPGQRPEVLQRLALLRREQGALWAAARTELRLLALVPNDTTALERLAAIYAETGEFERLDAALTLLCERAASEQERESRLFDRAVALARLGDDADGAAELIEQAFAPAERDGRDPSLEALRRGVGLLFAVAPERAFRLLLSLAQRATADRSRDLIEEAVFMAEHRLGRPDLALSAASQGALRQPQHEPFVATLERLGKTAGQPELLVTTLEEAAERCDLLPRQAELLVRAAKVAEDELDDAVRASVLLDRAYRATPTKALEELVLGCASRLFARDVRAGKLAYDRLRDTLHVRAKFGAPIARIQALMMLARLSSDVYLSREDALGYTDAARTALLNEVPEADRELALADLEGLAARLSSGGSTMRPLSRAPEKPRKSLVTELDAPMSGLPQSARTLRPAASLSPAVARPPVGRIPPAAEHAAPLISIAPFTVRPQGGSPITNISVEGLPPARTPEAVSRSPESLVAAVSAGDSAALRQLTDLLQREPERSPGVSIDLLARARAGSFNVCTLRALRLASAGAHEHALWRTSSQALAFFEPPLRPPPSGRRRDGRSAQWGAALTAARATEQQAGLFLLAQLVEAAAPLFRKPLSSVSGLGKDPAPLHEAPYSPLLNDLANTFGTEHEAYLAKNGEDRVSVLSVLPAHLIVGDRTPPDTSSLRFRLARAFEAARPENVLLTTLPTPLASTLLSAVSAAFADSTPAHVSREAAALAADLWRTMPSKAQRTLAALLKALPAPLQLADCVAAVQLRTARVALFATRELDVALAQLGLDGDAAEARIERTEGGLNRALLEKPLVQALVSYAFSDAYLGAVVENS
ncbi:MAG: domain protein putative component of TonB system [Myxococcaceae bacterium]|nr:domain protein putative component of TonB system [Myxococcaceae bacterium]